MGLFFLHLWHVGPTLKSQLISNSFLIPSADMCGGNIQLSGSTGEHSPFCTQAAPPEAQVRPLPAAPFVEGFTLHLPLSQGFGLHIKAKLTQDSPNQSSCPLHCQWSLTVLGTTLFWKSRGDLGILRSPSHRLGGGAGSTAPAVQPKDTPHVRPPFPPHVWVWNCIYVYLFLRISQISFIFCWWINTCRFSHLFPFQENENLKK